MGVPVPWVSPYIQEFTDYMGRPIRITVTFNDVTRMITGITLYRDPACLFNYILIGLGTDGIPDHSDKAIQVPAGETVVGQGQLNFLANKGLATIEDIDALQITCGR